MTEKEKDLFGKLRANRLELERALNQPAASGLQDQAIEKYGDEAHFVYELLQNANDARATQASFELRSDHLLFKHNGSVRFTLSDPDTEFEDKRKGQLGHLNAITAYGNSSKSQKEIGRYGLGFKAVFQYANTVEIYEDNFCFALRGIIPTLLPHDHVGRQRGETIFRMLFDRPDCAPAQARQAISQKLPRLVYPILFLNNLQKVSMGINAGGEILEYRKRLIAGDNNNGMTCRLLEVQNCDSKAEQLWHFSRNFGDFDYSVCFWLDEQGKLTPRSLAAFCFFPTRENTGLKFAIHAPFYLNDSRESIWAGEKYRHKNMEMVKKLALLAADALEYLAVSHKTKRYIDHNLLDIIPTDASQFASMDDPDRISFRPFYAAILNKLQTSPILPAKQAYAAKSAAWWGKTNLIQTRESITSLCDLFPDTLLKEVLHTPDACWVFYQHGRGVLENNKAHTTIAYLDSITNGCTDGDDLLNLLSPEFMEARSIDWLHTFYQWLDENKIRRKRALSLPIFINSVGKAQPAVDKAGKFVLYLPAQSTSEYPVLSPELIQNPETLSAFKHMGFAPPSLQDEIFQKLLPRYKSGQLTSTYLQDFRKVYDYYTSKERTASERDELRNSLRDCQFFLAAGNPPLLDRPTNLHFPDPALHIWFAGDSSARFLDLDWYTANIAPLEGELLRKSLEELGIWGCPAIGERVLTRQEAHSLPIAWEKPAHCHINKELWVDTWLTRLPYWLDKIISEKNLTLSRWLWDLICDVLARTTWVRERGVRTHSLLFGKHYYDYCGQHLQNFPSETLRQLRNCEWLVNEHGEWCKPGDTTTLALINNYDFSTDTARILGEHLGIATTHDPRASFQSVCEAIGLTPQEALEALKATSNSRLAWKMQEIASNAERLLAQKKTPQERKEKLIPGVAQEKRERAERLANEADESRDRMLDTSINLDKEIQKIQNRAIEDMARLELLEERKHRVAAASKYSWAWFDALLELEGEKGAEVRQNNKEISLSFGHVQVDPAAGRTFILSQPDRYIPGFVEELDDIPLVLHMSDHSEASFIIEAINMRSDSIKVRVRPDMRLASMIASDISYAVITAKSPAFLLAELHQGLKNLAKDKNWAEEYSLKDTLPGDIDYVFGPPGTGKTTYLAKNIILPAIRQEDRCQILILAPTNKAADVMTNAVIAASGHPTPDWLTRFGTTGDDSLVESGIYKDRACDVSRRVKNVTITTIARFPYDYWLGKNGRHHHLKSIGWDMIIIDEASMIPIFNLIYPLHLLKDRCKFIIAGDPLQIGPIVNVEEWEDENIYTMVGLQSFRHPATEPPGKQIKKLDTQYRSLPEIGNVISCLFYESQIKASRQAANAATQFRSNPLQLGCLNIIKYPVSPYESIFKAKRINGSSYHLYSGILAFELAMYLARVLKPGAAPMRIGVISPYRIQADIINRLMERYPMPENIQMLAGTVHCFQGDECEIIIALFNPPPSLTSPHIHLNKANIVNVAISRARDMLCILMPDEQTKNVENLELIRQLEQVCKKSPQCRELTADEVEKAIFGQADFLQNNIFVTGHQAVNVYESADWRYEIRAGDTSLDMQLHQATFAK